MRLAQDLRKGVTIMEPPHGGIGERLTAYRWHIDDPIPFTSRLIGNIERRSFIQATAPNGSNMEFTFKYRPDSYSSVAFFYRDGVYDPSVTPEEERFWRFPSAGADRMAGVEVWIEQPDMLRAAHASAVSVRRETVRFCLHKSCTLFETTDSLCLPDHWLSLGLNISTPGLYVLQALHVLGDSGAWNVSVVDATRGDVLPITGHESVLLDSRDNVKYKDQVPVNWPENFDLGTLAEHRFGVVNFTALGNYEIRFSCALPANAADPHATVGRLALDAVYARRLQIADPWGWMEDYLAKEKVYKAKQVSDTVAGVAEIASAVERFKEHSGKFPAEQPDASVPASLGAGVGLDAYHQSFLYREPGMANPFSYDVYSRAGDSSSPSGWIGNWRRPFVVGAQPNVLGFEGERMAVTGRSSSQVRSVAQTISSNCNAPISNGSLLFVRPPDSGDGAWVELAVSSTPLAAGRYEAVALLVSSWNYGTVRWSVCSGAACVGSEANAFTQQCAPQLQNYLGPSRIGRFASAANGSLELPAPGLLRLRLEVVGKDARSLGYAAGLDALALRRLG